MNDQDRDMLLARLDERTKNIVNDLSEAENSIKKSIEKVIQRQEEQNEYIDAAIGDIRGHDATINSFKWIGGIFVTAFLALMGFFIDHIKG